MNHKLTNHFGKCIKCVGFHSSIVSTSVPLAGSMRLPSCGFLRGTEKGFGNQGKLLLSSTTSVLHSNAKWNPSNNFNGDSQSKTYYSTFTRTERRDFCKQVSPHSCDFVVRLIGTKASEITTSNETKTLDVLESQLQDHQKTSQGLEIAKRTSDLSVDIDNDYEAETDFIFSGRKLDKDEMVSYDINQLSVYKDGVEPPLPSEIRTENIKALSYSISTAETCCDIFHIYEQHRSQLKFLHYELIAKRISNVIDRSPLKEVYCRPVFLQLCEQFCKDCCQYDPPMLLSLLHMLTSLKLPSNSLIMLTTLQMLRKKFDFLDVKELLQLDALLRIMPQSTLVNALQKAIVLALESMYYKLDLPSVLTAKHLSHGMFVCASSDTSESLTVAEKFMMTLYDDDQGVEDLSVPQAVTLLTGLLEIFQRWKTTPGRQQVETELQEEEDQLYRTSKQLSVEQLSLARDVLLSEVLHYLTKNFSQLSSSEVEDLQKMLSWSFANGDRCAYSEDLLEAFARRVLKEGESLEFLAGGVCWMLKMNAVDGSLVQAMVKKLAVTSCEELCCSQLLVMPLVHALAATDALHHWPNGQRLELLDRLLQHPSVSLPSQEIDESSSRVRLALDIASLGHFPPVLYTGILDAAAADALKALEGSTPGSRVHHFMTLWQAQQLLDPQKSDNKVDEKVLSASKEFLLSGFSTSGASQRALVRQVLQHIFSDHSPNTVVTRVHTRHALLIDHVVVVRECGGVVPQPAAKHSQSSLSLDQLTVPDDAKVLAVVEVGPNKLLNNYTTLRPLARLQLQLLAAEGVMVVPLIMPNFMLRCRTHQEKINYVSEAFSKHISL